MLDIAALWIGGKLPPHGAACLTSFVAHGHPLTLFTYGRVENVPACVTIADANAILPEAASAAFARAGKFAQFANYFRYRLLVCRPGICWVDTDAYCLRPFENETHIFGWQDGAVIANGILALPPDSEVLAKLLNMFEDRNFVPDWIGRRRHLLRARAMLGRPVGKQYYPWGSLGPLALTYYLKKAGLEARAKPPTHFYPLHWCNIGRLFEPDAEWDGILKGAYSIHLWNEFLRKRDDRHAPPPGSLLWKILNGGLKDF